MGANSQIDERRTVAETKARSLLAGADMPVRLLAALDEQGTQQDTDDVASPEVSSVLSTFRRRGTIDGHALGDAGWVLVAWALALGATRHGPDADGIHVATSRLRDALPWVHEVFQEEVLRHIVNAPTEIQSQWRLQLGV